METVGMFSLIGMAENEKGRNYMALRQQHSFQWQFILKSTLYFCNDLQTLTVCIARSSTLMYLIGEMLNKAVAIC